MFNILAYFDRKLIFQELVTPTSLAHRAIESFNNKVQSLSTKLPKKAWQDDLGSDDEGIATL